MDYFGISAVEFVGDSSLRKYALTNNTQWLAMGVAGYIGVVTYLIYILRKDNLLRMNSMWDGASALLNSILAYWLMGDRFTTTQEYVGTGFIIIGLFMMEWGRED